jgi:isopentenyldiphosphate isomerase
VLDADGRPTGVRKPRGEVHRDGDWHGALHIWVGGIGPDGVPFVLLQRRSQSKDTWPGALDVAVGGHLRAGETLAEAIREAEEEIGLSIGLADVVRLGRRFALSVSGTDNEVQEVLGVRSDRPLGAYRLHEEEVDGIVSVPLPAAIDLFDGSRDAVGGVELRRGDAAAGPVDVTIEGFAAGERRGYPALALRGLWEVLDGRAPQPFELRR